MANPDVQIRGGVGGGGGLKKKIFFSALRFGLKIRGRGTYGLDVNESSARLSVARYHILLNKQVILYSPHHILQISGQCCTWSTDSLQRDKSITNHDWWKAGYLIS